MHHPVSLIAGASGLIGSHVLRYLIEKDQSCILVVRQKIEGLDDNIQQVITNFSHLDKDLSGSLPVVDHFYLCLGLRLKTNELIFMDANKKQEFAMVDFDHSLALANIAFKNGAKKISIVSAAGADANSFNYYAKIKGKLEQAISDIGFEQVTIARPGHLLGLREESRGVEIPILETGLKLAEPFMPGPLKNFRQIEASKVAAAMVRVTNTDRSGKQILHFNDFVS